MTSSRLVLKNTAAHALSQLAERVSSLVLTLLVARTLGAEGLGIYAAALVAYQIVRLTAEMGWANLLIREIARDQESAGRYLWHAGIIATGACVPVTVLVLLVLPHLGYSADMTASIQVIVLGIVPGCWRSIQEAVFVATQRVRYMTYGTLVAALTQLAVSVFLLYRGHGIVSLVVAFVTTQAVIVVTYCVFLRAALPSHSRRVDWGFARMLLRGVWPFAGSSVLGGLFARPEIFILSLVRTEAEIGYYSAALRIVDLWDVVCAAYATNVFPILSKASAEGSDESQAILQRSARYLLAISMPLAAGIWATAGPIMTLFYGDGFGPAVPALRLMTWAIPLYFLSQILWRALVAKEGQAALFRVNLLTTPVRLAGGAILIAGAGHMGAAINMPLNFLLVDSLILMHLRRAGTHLPIWRLAAPFASASLLMAGVIWIARHQLSIWALVPLGAAVYFLLLLVLGVLSSHELRIIRRLGRSEA